MIIARYFPPESDFERIMNLVLMVATLGIGLMIREAFQLGFDEKGGRKIARDITHHERMTFSDLNHAMQRLIQAGEFDEVCEELRDDKSLSNIISRSTYGGPDITRVVRGILLELGHLPVNR